MLHMREIGFTSVENVIRGGIFGLACGDALGAPVEFMTRDSIIQLYSGPLTEMVGGWLNTNPGGITDDTEMMLCVAHGLIENPLSPRDAVGQRFMDWYHSSPMDIGNDTAAALLIYDQFQDWDRAGRPAATGNGCLMRTLPISFAYVGSAEILAKSILIAEMTHKSAIAAKCCAYYNFFVSRLLDSDRRKPSGLSNSAINLQVDEDSLSLKPTGHVFNTLYNALWAFLRTDTFEDAVVSAVNLGGDADTNGAVAGGIAGTYYGFDAIPKRWLAVLKRKVELEEVTSGLIELYQALSVENNF
jgi:ADP-ribosyl-[dinitrogen reductase] hydrolase